MSHSVVVFAGEPKFIEGGTMRIDFLMPGTNIPHVQSFFWDIIAKQEEERDGGFAVHLRPGCCVEKTDKGYTIHVCMDGDHGPPIMVLSPETVLRVEGDHEFECHHKDLPIM